MAELTSILSEEKDAEDREQDVDSAEVIANQAQQIFNKGSPWRKRCDTFFYTVVLGGDTQTIDHTIQHMHDNGMEDVLNWLLRRKTTKISAKFLDTGISCIRWFVTFSILLLVNFLATPVFYIIHSLTCSLISKTQQHISKDIRLPLAYAVFSQKKEMWRYFSSLPHVSIMDSDSDGNNVFHYIAHLSAEAPDRAVTMFKTLMENTSDADSMKTLIVEQTNSSGLSPLAFTAKFGSPVLLNEILHYPNLLQHSVLQVQEGKISFGTKDKARKVDKVDKALVVDTSQDTRIDHVDVSKYECGEFVHQSAVLNLLSARNLMGMASSDLKLFQNASVLHAWMSLKVKQMILKVVSLHAADVVVTCMLLIFSLQFIHFYAPVVHSTTQRVRQSALTALSENTSYFFKADAFSRVLDEKRQKELRSILRDMDEEEKMDLFNNTSNLHPELDDNISMNMENAQILDAVVDTALMNNVTHWEKFYILQHLRYFLVSYAKLIYDEISVPSNTSIFHGNVSIDMQSVGDLLQPLCIWEHFTTDDLRMTSPVHAEIYHGFDLCRFAAELELSSNKSCVYLPPAEALKGLYFHRYIWCFSCLALQKLASLFLFGYLLIDLVERSCFMYLVAAQRWDGAYRRMKTTLGTKIPGSYVRKQLNILSCLFCFPATFILSIKPGDFQKYFMFVMISLIIRLMMHIHSLRLLPSIGHFVVTMFKMGTNMVHFSVIYGIVIFIFSAIFNKILINPECPAERVVGFTSLPESVLSTFSLAFGHGETDPFYSNTIAQVTYVLYLLIMGLLLMNLIIAIMSSTATDVMKEPWRDVLWHMEWLEEALSAEFTYSVLALPCRRCCRSCYSSHQLVGYVVEKHPSKIYIPITFCPQLH